MGYYQAGFEEIVGVDIEPQPNYPFEFFQTDISEWLRSGGPWSLESFDLIHASPPCQAYTTMNNRWGSDSPDLIAKTRALLEASGVPYVIENVEGAPLVDPVMLCGTMFPELRVLRHRLFETSFPVEPPSHGRHPLVFTHDKRKNHYGKLDQDTSHVQVTGGGNCTVANARDAMEIDWMTWDEIREAIPPAYTKFIGEQFLAQVNA